jgi:hypothetical protein
MRKERKMGEGDERKERNKTVQKIRTKEIKIRG